MPKKEKVSSFPVQLISMEDAVLIIRGCHEILISGEDASPILTELFRATIGRAIPREDLINQFAAAQRDSVARIIEHLIQKNIIRVGDETVMPSAESETELDIFYWHLGVDKENAISKCNDALIAILGVNRISRQMSICLSESGISNFKIFDDPLLRNQRLFPGDELDGEQWLPISEQPTPIQEMEEVAELEEVDCIIATSDFGTTPIIRKWNQVCVEYGKSFLPVVLNRMIGYVGPFVVPGETACYECLLNRENANLGDFRIGRASEKFAFESQHLRGHHPTMASIAANVAVMEMTRMYCGAMPPKVGDLIEIKMAIPQITSRKVLKLPRCGVCSPLIKKSSTNLNIHSFPPSSPLSKPAFGNK